MTRKVNTQGFGNNAYSTVVCPRCNGVGWVSPETVTIGDRFKELRMAAKMTQEEAAAQMGVSRPQLANIEVDRGRPGLESLVAAADLFSVSLDYLLGRNTLDKPYVPSPELEATVSTAGKGKAGGIARAKALSTEQRGQIARKAAKARWGKPEDRSN